MTISKIKGRIGIPILGTEQSEVININNELRLRKFDSKYDFALEWYQNEETVKLVDGPNVEKYDHVTLKRMYEYLNNIGELYFIEIRENNGFIPIGDVTFCKDDMSMVIGAKKYRGKGIGKKVIEALILRAKDLALKELKVREI
ncbi:GNAT family N-acetyltransferase [Tepidimicrobium xylanilyticum]|uniref:Acetyltransferase (GNAT) domain-containing protein n=1 Tax=Tepidimicrobium xylanilyticum TaxID=1123352 RepID=A0A1H3E0H6_9FIRM|nr:GNAT family N-acetyltransferase [Tepidimicrobium xylanilyticum]GMG97037.1 N-acetyltransferase [Tepidimicrobium xylanilyticum]SDX72203.1 Acetyltransferase (GNAT) domain-containing protein [Tepidimicrobium xylanilyticum]